MNPEYIFKLRSKYLHECRVLQRKEAEWLDTYFPSRVNIEDRKSADTKTESAEMPVTPKESAMDEFDPSAIFDI